MPLRWGFPTSVDISVLFCWCPDSGLSQYSFHIKCTRLSEASMVSHPDWVFENQVFARCSSSSRLQSPSPQWCVSKWLLNYMSTVCLPSSLESPNVKAVWFCVLCLVLGQSLASGRCLGNSCEIGLNLHADLWNHMALLSPFPPRYSSPSASPDHSPPAVLRGPGCAVWSGFVSSLPTNFCF